MSVEIDFPLEFIVEGVPLSLQASAASRTAWKAEIRDSARRSLQEGHFLTEKPIAVSILYFPRERMVGDLDNIAKPILDALVQLIYFDDNQVERLLLQKFEPERFASFSNPTPMLADALEGVGPMVYIRVDDDHSRDG